MGTLYIDRKDIRICLDGNSLAFYAGDVRDGIVPICPLKRVVVVGNVIIETPVLHKLARENVSVVFLSGKRLRFSGMLHGSLHNNGLLRVKQYQKASSELSLILSREIVARKIMAQHRFLELVRQNRPDLRLPLTTAMSVIENIHSLLNETVSTETLMGYEGGASAAYFKAYTELFPDSLDFNCRNRRPPEDPVNAMLSLCYTLLHYEIVREIEVIGLDPVVGFYHKFDYGRESLACDLVEPYRPEVDRLVYQFFRERKFTLRDFAFDDERPGCYLKKEGRKRFYPLYEEWARQMRSVWTDEVRTLVKRIIDGQDAVSL